MGELVSTQIVEHNFSIREMECLKRPQLTAREIEVLQHAADGETCRVTGEVLGLSMWYIKNSRNRAQLKLGADNTAHAVAIALRKGIIQ